MIAMNEAKLNILISGYSGAQFRNVSNVDLGTIMQIDNDYQLSNEVLVGIYNTLAGITELSNNNAQIIIWLVEAKEMSKLLEPFCNGNTLLHNAVYENNYNLTLLLINWVFRGQGTTVINSKNNRGWTCLHTAAIGILKRIGAGQELADWRVISILLEKGADIKAETDKKYTTSDIFKSASDELAVKFWAVVNEQEEVDSLTAAITNSLVLQGFENGY